MGKPTVGVVLSGCGVFDGSEIHEAVCVLLALDEARAEAVCLAPDVDLDEVDHLTQRPTGARRSVLREAARIARGKVSDIAKANAKDLDALILPGGFGAMKNLCTLDSAGRVQSVNAEVERLILQMAEAGKPLGFACIAPALAAKALQKLGGAQLTIGHDAGTASGIEALGSKHVACDCRNVVVDTQRRVVSTPAYMLGPGIADVHAGISKMVREVLALCRAVA
jgi:enhancing lycopene biosynthesis protein 2